MYLTFKIKLFMLVFTTSRMTLDASCFGQITVILKTTHQFLTPIFIKNSPNPHIYSTLHHGWLKNSEFSPERQWSWSTSFYHSFSPLLKWGKDSSLFSTKDKAHYLSIKCPILNSINSIMRSCIRLPKTSYVLCPS